jgi:hypothetical protein
MKRRREIQLERIAAHRSAGTAPEFGAHAHAVGGKGDTQQVCHQCGTVRQASNLLSERIPGVGTIYRCRTCPEAAT